MTQVSFSNAVAAVAVVVVVGGGGVFGRRWWLSSGVIGCRAAHRNRISTGLRLFFTGTRTVPLGFFFLPYTPRQPTVSVGLRP